MFIYYNNCNYLLFYVKKYYILIKKKTLTFEFDNKKFCI